MVTVIVTSHKITEKDVEEFKRMILWQPLITKTNNHTSNKSLRMDIKWEFHKRTQQGVSAKLESYIYQVLLVCATNN